MWDYILLASAVFTGTLVGCCIAFVMVLRDLARKLHKFDADIGDINRRTVDNRSKMVADNIAPNTPLLDRLKRLS